MYVPWYINKIWNVTITLAYIKICTFMNIYLITNSIVQMLWMGVLEFTIICVYAEEMHHFVCHNLPCFGPTVRMHCHSYSNQQQRLGDKDLVLIHC